MPDSVERSKLECIKADDIKNRLQCTGHWRRKNAAPGGARRWKGPVEKACHTIQLRYRPLFLLGALPFFFLAFVRIFFFSS